MGLLAGAARAQAVLYNGNLLTTPNAQGYLAFGTVGSGTQTFNSSTGGVTNVTTLDTTPGGAGSLGNYAGYSNYNATATATGTAPFFSLTTTTPVNAGFPTLNRALGYVVSFTMQQVSESHASAARAGFSIIALSSDKQGVEIGFQQDTGAAASSTIFSQSPTFTVAESVSGSNIAAFTNALTAYNLRVQGSTYTLSTGSTTLLTGALKDYTGATNFAASLYNTPNFLFLGDDTTSAQGITNLRAVSVAVAPEPASLALLLPALGGIACRLRRRAAR